MGTTNAFTMMGGSGARQRRGIRRVMRPATSRSAPNVMSHNERASEIGENAAQVQPPRSHGKKNGNTASASKPLSERDRTRCVERRQDRKESVDGGKDPDSGKDLTGHSKITL